MPDVADSGLWQSECIYRRLYYHYVQGWGHTLARQIHIPGGDVDSIAGNLAQNVREWIQKRHPPQRHRSKN